MGQAHERVTRWSKLVGPMSRSRRLVFETSCLVISALMWDHTGSLHEAHSSQPFVLEQKQLVVVVQNMAEYGRFELVLFEGYACGSFSLCLA